MLIRPDQTSPSNCVPMWLSNQKPSRAALSDTSNPAPEKPLPRSDFSKPSGRARQSCERIPGILERNATMHVRDRIVVVTGAASGIGRALAQRFAEEDAKLVVCSDLN